MTDGKQIPFFLILMLIGIAQCRNEYKRKQLEEVLKNYEPVYRPDNLQNESGPIMVKVSIQLESFGNFDTFSMDFSFNIIFRKFWTDSRLILPNCSRDDKLVLDDVAQKLWIPKFYFPESVGQVQKMLNSELTWLSPHSGDLVHSERINVKISCHLDLSKFPMDKQKCPIRVSTYGYSNKDLILHWWHPEAFEMPESGDIDLSDFNISKIYTVNVPECISTGLGNFSCIVAILYLERQYTHYLINTFMPSGLIVSISWIAFLVDYKSAPARISLGLLSILSLITQYTITISYTPKISYIKAIDVWLFSCLAFVIVTLLEFAFINWFYREGGKPPHSFTVLRKKGMGKKCAVTNDKTAHSNESDQRNTNVNLENTIEYEAEIKLPLAPNSQTAPIVHPEKKTGYQIDCVFFIIYPFIFSIFAIVYWNCYFYN